MVDNIPSSIISFYILSAGIYTSDLFSNQLKTFLKTNRYAKHTIGYITILTLLILFSKNNIYQSIIYAFIGYFWLLLTTKMDIQWNIIVFILLYLLFMYKVDYDKKKLEGTEYNENKKNHKKKMTIYMIIIFIVTLLGSYMFLNKQYIQHGGNANINDFLLQ